MDILFNINNFIKVKLTEEGQKVVQEDYEYWHSIYPYIVPKYVEDSDGYTQFQMWKFMNLFGFKFRNGGPCYIEGNVMLLEVEDE